MSTLIGILYAFLEWIFRLFLYVPVQFLRLIGLLIPPCTETQWDNQIDTLSQGLLQGLMFLWPLAKYLPWDFIFTYLFLILTVLVLHWLIGHLPQVLSFAVSFWYIIAIFFVISFVLDLFLSDSWRESDIFVSVFGVAPTSTFDMGGDWGSGGSW